MQDKGLEAAFWPIFQLDEAEEEKNKLLQGGMRFGVAVSLIGMSYAFYHHVPDRGDSLLRAHFSSYARPFHTAIFSYVAISLPI